MSAQDLTGVEPHTPAAGAPPPGGPADPGGPGEPAEPGAARLDLVEATTARHPDVAEVAAVLLDGAVTAALVPIDFASAPAIRDHLWAVLGDDAPATVALLAALPRDAAGEVDRAELRRVLAEDDPPRSTFVPPRSGRETQIAEVLQDVLDLPRVGLDDDFLELGGDSLRAIELVNQLDQRLGVQISLEDVFDAATVRKLAGGA
ncbi:phosphopantetheine-binding protein [Dactylosporangium sp. NPDC050688]|uniref:phosphopantetheine-binding protein n=1 Tax=Dactylosporangium sp. NPDC050688 TaxID=3157217 RepID=UPI0033FEB6EE